jgi:aryl-alcohol dehydrogenase-like predicted oxidoreductase
MHPGMRYKILGKSGLRVSELCLGTMTFGEDWGFGASKEESRRVFDAFVERGGNFIDTANLYTSGTSERFVGEFVAGSRGRFVVATKYTLSTNPDDPNASGNHRKNLVQALHASLERLGTDYIDLLWVHAWDGGLTPIDEVMRALDDVVRAGKVLYVGISDTPAWVVSQANTLADLRGWSRFVGLQIEYSLIARTPERELLPMAKALDLAVTPWGAIGGGVLSGKYSKGQPADSKRVQANQHRVSERSLSIAAEVDQIAAEIERTPSQIALAWVRQQAGVIVPIIAARKLDQIVDNLASTEVTLGGEHLARLHKASAIELGFPHDFLSSDQVGAIVHGKTRNLVDNHRK